MKKRFMKVMAVLMTGAMLAGCGNNAAKQPQEQKEAEIIEKTDAADNSADAEETADTADADGTADTQDTADTKQAAETFEATTVTVFAAKSLNTVLDELITLYNETQPNVTFVTNYDSSGTLMTQIEEGAVCDVFFSAAQSQMNQLEEDGLIVDGTRYNVVNNQVCVVTYKDSGTSVTGLADLENAKSMALADGSVPVGKYTRQALVNSGVLEETEDAASIPTQTVSDALGGLEINECANVGAVAAAVAEGANEVGTVYYSDTFGYEEKLEILEIIPYDLTGNVIYPVAQVVNAEADELESGAAEDFISFLISDKAKEVFQKYYFDTEVER